MKKITSLLLSVVMLLSITTGLNLSALAATSGNYEYTVAGGEATITKYKGSESKITVPAKLGNVKVTVIGESAFSGVTATSVVLPEGVKRIDDYGFFGCKNLKSITLPKTIERIWYRAFSMCKSLTDVYYNGTKEQWAKVTVLNGEDMGNQELFDAALHYGTSADCANNKHSYKSTVTKATITSNGKIVKKCSVCGKTTTTTVAKASSIKLSRNTFTTNGNVQRPSVTVYDSKGKQLTYKKDFKVDYSNWSSKNVGRYTVTIKLIGNYSGTKTYPYYINPKPTEFVPSNKGGFKAVSKGFTLKWNKQASQTTGYQIQYATKRDFSNAATITIANPNTTSKTIKGRAGNTRYYVRVRTYKKIGNGTFYSNWNSGVKSVVTLR